MAFLGFLVPILISAGVQAGLAWLSKAINPTPQSGRLGQDDFHALESAYDLPLPKCWGTERVPGNITWISPVREHKYNVGSGLFSDGTDVFYYTQDVEYSFTLGPAKAFVKIWLGDKVIYDQSGAPTDAQSGAYGGGLAALINQWFGPAVAAKDRILESYELFLGTDDQQPSNIVSAVEGYGTVPADRGIVKVVIKNVNLTKLGGNTLPSSSAIIQFAEYTPVSSDQVITLTPTIAESGDDGGAGSHSGGTFGGVNGSATADLTSGEVTMTGSCGLCNAKWQARWRGFTAPTLPDGATITEVHAKCEAREWDPTGVFNSSYSIVGAVGASWNHGTLGGEFGPASHTSEPSTFETVTGSSFGSSVSDIENAVIDARFYQTLNLTGDGHMQIQNPRLEVHYSLPLVPPTGTTLAAIVADLCEEAGLDSTEYDVSELTSVPVKGFKTEQKAIRDVVRELMEVYPFDGYESDGKLKFVLRSGDTVDTIEEADFVLTGENETAYRLSEPITQDNEIPMKTEVHYADIDRDFQDSVQYSKRINQWDPTSEPARLQAPYGAYWPVAQWSMDAVQIDFTAGYGEPLASPVTGVPIPPDIIDFMLAYIGFRYENREGQDVPKELYNILSKRRVVAE